MHQLLTVDIMTFLDNYNISDYVRRLLIVFSLFEFHAFIMGSKSRHFQHNELINHMFYIRKYIRTKSGFLDLVQRSATELDIIDNL